MINIYFEHSNANKNTDEAKEFAFNVNADIYESGLAEVCTYIKDKHSHFKDVVDVFSTAIKAVKSFLPVCFDIDNENEQSYSLEIEPDEGTVSVKIFNSEFDVEELMQNYTYAVGYLQCSLLNCDNAKKGEHNFES